MRDEQDTSAREMSSDGPGRAHDPSVLDRRDALISRVIDGEASEGDWTALRTLAAADPAVWTDLAETQGQHELLAVAIDEVGMLADGVEIPERELLTPAERFQRRMDGVRAWGGWAAAAAILLVWFTGLPAPMSPEPDLSRGNTSTAGFAPALGGFTNAGSRVGTPDEALADYLDAGREAGTVIGMMPEKVVLESRPLADGSGMEVVFMRQILEREFVPADKVYKVGRDEFGSASILPAPPKQSFQRSSY